LFFPVTLAGWHVLGPPLATAPTWVITASWLAAFFWMFTLAIRPVIEAGVSMRHWALCVWLPWLLGLMLLAVVQPITMR
jgi:hypothetical protein